MNSLKSIGTALLLSIGMAAFYTLYEIVYLHKSSTMAQVVNQIGLEIALFGIGLVALYSGLVVFKYR